MNRPMTIRLGGNEFLHPSHVLNQVYPFYPRVNDILGGIIVTRFNQTGVGVFVGK